MVGKIALTAGQFVRFPALNGTLVGIHRQCGMVYMYIFTINYKLIVSYVTFEKRGFACLCRKIVSDSNNCVQCNIHAVCYSYAIKLNTAMSLVFVFN